MREDVVDVSFFPRPVEGLRVHGMFAETGVGGRGAVGGSAALAEHAQVPVLRPRPLLLECLFAEAISAPGGLWRDGGVWVGRGGHVAATCGPGGN